MLETHQKECGCEWLPTPPPSLPGFGTEEAKPGFCSRKMQGTDKWEQCIAEEGDTVRCLDAGIIAWIDGIGFQLSSGKMNSRPKGT